jgi:hypothetical protein
MNRWIIISVFFSVIFLTGGLAPACAALLQDEFNHQDDSSDYNLERCPPAKHDDHIRLNGNVVSIPKDIHQGKKFLDQIHSPDKDESFSAIMSLALAGNLDAFNQLLGLENPEKLRFYCSFYQNQDELQCVDPILEAAVIDYLEEPDRLESLLQLFRKNLYQRYDLFEKLLNLKLDITDTKRFELITCALVANNIKGIEASVLQHALNNVARIDKKFWWFVRPVDKHYLDFFVKRQYEPSLDLIEVILNHGHYSSVSETYRVHLYNRQRAVYYQLDKFTTPKAGDIFINQLEKITDVPFDNYMDMELEAAGNYAVKHAHSDAQVDLVISCLTEILNHCNKFYISSLQTEPTEEIKTQLVDRIYYNTLMLLSKTGSDEAASVLIDELKQLVDTRKYNGASDRVAYALSALSKMPPSAVLNVPDFLSIVSKLDKKKYFLAIVMVLEKNPHPEGFKYLLSQLEYAALAGKEGTIVFYGLAPKDTFNWLINVLLIFEKGEYLFQSRQEVDRLFLEKKIDVALYETVSIKINTLTGDESPVYAEMLAKKEADERLRRKKLAAEKKAEIWKDYQTQIDTHLSPEGIKKNIQMYILSGAKEKTAISWLILAGTKILPYVHEILRDENTSQVQKFKLITLLGIIGDSQSNYPIIQVLQKHPDMIHKDVLLSLSYIPTTEESYHFVETQLRKAKSIKIKQTCLVYFAIQKEMKAFHYIDRFTNESAEKNLKISALFLAARLGEEKAIKQIARMLELEPERSEEAVLLRSLAELVPPEKLQELVQKSGINPHSENFRNATLRSSFIHGPEEKKTLIAERLLSSEYLWDRREAVQYLLGKAEFNLLSKYILIDARVEMPYMIESLHSHIGQLIILEASKMGYQILDQDEGIVFKSDSVKF